MIAGTQSTANMCVPQPITHPQIKIRNPPTEFPSSVPSRKAHVPSFLALRTQRVRTEVTMASGKPAWYEGQTCPSRCCPRELTLLYCTCYQGEICTQQAYKCSHRDQMTHIVVQCLQTASPWPPPLVLKSPVPCLRCNLTSAHPGPEKAS